MDPLSKRIIVSWIATDIIWASLSFGSRSTRRIEGLLFLTRPKPAKPWGCRSSEAQALRRRLPKLAGPRPPARLRTDQRVGTPRHEQLAALHTPPRLVNHPPRRVVPLPVQCTSTAHRLATTHPAPRRQPIPQLPVRREGVGRLSLRALPTRLHRPSPSPRTARFAVSPGEVERGERIARSGASYPCPPRNPPSDAPRGHEDGRRALRYCLVSGDPPAESPALVGRHPTGRSAPCRRLGGRSAGLQVVAQLGVGDGWGRDH